MRPIVRAVRHVRSASRLRELDAFSNCLCSRPGILANQVGGSSCVPSYNKDMEGSLHHVMVSRALFTPAAKVTSEGLIILITTFSLIYFSLLLYSCGTIHPSLT